MATIITDIKVQTKGYEVALKTRFQPYNPIINLELFDEKAVLEK